MLDRPFALIGVNNDNLERAREAVDKNQLSWRNFQDKGSETVISADWMVNAWPTIVVLDAERKIHYRGHSGERATEIAKELVAAMK